ncbi:MULTISPECIES: DUF4232 domain-containing protein [unclassified Nocardioides]|uniref:DUF4232 domain-containing protein n=1 Tax=unclassified Nocardioides TaxID=2615069 RepID=UPI000056F47C|nr:MULTISPECIES: DUF4232 domain-containing protein [unclassified Nocardioides]ABL80238.1 conserved hypothetical protein [Nocardioides sp. JS614]
MRIIRMLGAAGLVVAGLVVPSGVAQATTVPACTNAELHASYHRTDAGMSHRYGRLVLRNVSDHACRTGGYGGLSYVGGGDGTQIGAPADREPSKVRTLVVKPGRKVVSVVSETDATVYPLRECRPAKVDGFRVYVPNETRSQFVVHRTIGCRNDRVHLITHKAYRRP